MTGRFLINPIKTVELSHQEIACIETALNTQLMELIEAHDATDDENKQLEFARRVGHTEQILRRLFMARMRISVHETGRES